MNRLHTKNTWVMDGQLIEHRKLIGAKIMSLGTYYNIFYSVWSAASISESELQTGLVCCSFTKVIKSDSQNSKPYR